VSKAQSSRIAPRVREKAAREQVFNGHREKLLAIEDETSKMSGELNERCSVKEKTCPTKHQKYRAGGF
jgi:hypothetical protein